MKKDNKEQKNTGKKREIEAVVVSNSMEKTVRVQVDRAEAHSVYKKRIKRKKVYFAHTDSELNIGDKVVIRESKPFSKKVRWVVINKVEAEEK